jgi:phosphoglycerate dehydrogenase-like enzyme
LISSRTILVGIYSPFAAWNIPAAYVDRLRGEFPHHRFLHARDEIEALERIPGAHVAFMSEVGPEQLAAAPHLEWIHSPAAGVGSMLFPAMIESRVLMSNSRGISADTIAEHVLAVTLVIFRKLPLALRSQAGRTWAQDAMLADPPLRTIAGSRVLIVGLGAIGTATARRMTALGARVTGIRRHAPLDDTRNAKPEYVDLVAAPDALLDLLPSADVVLLASPQTRETRGLIGARELAAMRRDAILVNVSRGKLVDEMALAAALTAPPAARTIGGAALDVFEHEPLSPDSPLWLLPNVLITPHTAGFRRDHWDAVTTLFAENLRRFESGQALLNVVDKEAGY